jgi:hypothetical protein
MVLLVEECLQDLLLLPEIARHRKRDIPTKDHPPETMETIKATALIGRMRVSVIFTIHIMINRSKDHNLPDLKCQTSMPYNQIPAAFEEEHQLRSISDHRKVDMARSSRYNLNLMFVVKLNLKQLYLKWLEMRLHSQMVIPNKDIKMMVMVGNIIKVHQISVLHLSKAMVTTINRMDLYHHHEVHQRRRGQAPALLVFQMAPSQASMVRLMVPL